jgi:crotonobetainyl-CoA:carnitine CoA-transferase CaiB-like acyl-CoA transferase
MQSQASTGSQPLSGIRVLDLGRMVAAPWCTQLLGDLGAEVIKVERPGTGDDMRGYGPPFLKLPDGFDDDSPYHLAVNRNKKSITIDLSTSSGQELVRGLATRCDVLVENYKVGTLARYGLDYAGVRRVRPDIIYCSVTGFGQTGPYAERPGLDILFQAASGLMSTTGEPDGPPQKVGPPISDLTAGMYATVAVLAAIRHRETNGGAGQHIDLALFDCQIASLNFWAQLYLVSGEAPRRIGANTPGNAPAGRYPCADGEIVLSAGSDRQFRTFAQVIGREDLLQDPRFAVRRARVENESALRSAISETLTPAPRAHWLELFARNGVMAAPINDIAEAFADPQVRHREMTVSTPHPGAGEVRLVANPLRFSETPVQPFASPPRLGQHTDEVLHDLLGLSHGELEALRRSGVI